MKYENGGIFIDTDSKPKIEYLWNKNTGNMCCIKIDDETVIDAKEVRLILDIDIKKCGLSIKHIGGGLSAFGPHEDGSFDFYIDFVGKSYSVKGPIVNPEISYCDKTQLGRVQHLEIIATTESPIVELNFKVFETPMGKILEDEHQ